MAASSSLTTQTMLANKSPATSVPNIPFLPRSSKLLSSPSSKLKFAGSKRSLSYCIKASSEDTSETSEVGEVFSGLKEKWDATENKPMVVIYGVGAVIGVWLASTVVDAINGFPVVPKFMELIGLGYTGWFIYRYLLFKSTRKELADDIEALKKKIIGSE
nr:protein curvature thylakoid 1A, chloroplastic-like [Tanacetum cinerariifolium]